MTTTVQRPATTWPITTAGHEAEPGAPNAPALERVGYQQTLDRVEAGLDQVHQLLRSSRRAHTADRAQRLSDLHVAVRAVGQLLNDAQGGWPPPNADDEAP